MVDTEQILLKQAERGAKADRWLKDEMTVEVFDAVEKHVLHMFRTAPLRDEEGIVKTKYLLHLLGLLKGAATQVARTGALAEQQLEERRRGVRQVLGEVWRSRQSRR